MPDTTYDGLAITSDPPFGASVIVFRRAGGAIEFLLLHRAERGPDYAGDWAWTPPAGARWPGEHPDEGARRELEEETGLTLPLRRAGQATANWLIYIAEAPFAAAVTLDAEHDRYAWLSAQEACARCAPDEVAAQIRLVARELG
ncbi:NUDIX domain-containing protein [Devosia nitrariae]